MGNMNKCYDFLAREYELGKSILDLSREFKMPISTIRNNLLSMSVSLRTRKEGIRLASSKNKFKCRSGIPHGPMSDETKNKISKTRMARYSKLAKGKCIKNGYLIITLKGPNLHRCEHDVIMEAIIDRKIKTGEVVHHIDGSRANNSIENLVLMTRSEHTSLHRREKCHHTTA